MTTRGRGRDLRVAALASVLALVVTACGGEAEVDTDEFIDAVEDVCRDTERAIDDLADPTGYAEARDYAESAEDIFVAAIDRLEVLTPPDDLAEPFAAFVGVFETTADTAVELARAADDEDDAAIETIGTTLLDLKAERDDLARDMGADRCISSPTDDSTPDTAPADTAPDDTAAPDDSTVDTTDDSTVDTPDDSTADTAVPDGGDASGGADVSGIATIALETQVNPPAGHTFQDAADSDVEDLKLAYASTPRLADDVTAVGSAYVIDESGTVVAVLFLTTWARVISDTEVEVAFVEEFTSTAETVEPGTTEAGIEHLVYVDADGAVGLLTIAGDISIWLLMVDGDADGARTLLDAFAQANPT